MSRAARNGTNRASHDADTRPIAAPVLEEVPESEAPDDVEPVLSLPVVEVLLLLEPPEGVVFPLRIISTAFSARAYVGVIN